MDQVDQAVMLIIWGVCELWTMSEATRSFTNWQERETPRISLNKGYWSYVYKAHLQ